jgi:hypothetical protein
LYWAAKSLTVMRCSSHSGTIRGNPSALTQFTQITSGVFDHKPPSNSLFTAASTADVVPYCCAIKSSDSPGFTTCTSQRESGPNGVSASGPAVGEAATAGVAVAVLFAVGDWLGLTVAITRSVAEGMSVGVRGRTARVWIVPGTAARAWKTIYPKAARASKLTRMRRTD